ncbi:MAG TPA: lamin tail domain-containing protein, partial [Anaerolineae bacterium]|nr:lamin tail domain-containing protein [Anaerolineae bacterium]
MGRMARVAGACLLGGLLAVGVAGGLHVRTQATAAAAWVASPGDVVINEVAWTGHAGYTADEWLELYNTTAQTVPLAGWRLDSSDGGPGIALDGAIPPHGYYLIERSDDETVSDVPADWTSSFGNGLSNAGEVLALTDSLGNTIDTANAGKGGAWPAGTSSSGAIPYATMERVDPATPDADANWCTNDGATRNGLDAGGTPINGTPKAPNSCYRPPTSNVADLTVGKSGPAAAGTGGPITYTIALHNAGALTATGVVVTDVLPAAVDFVAQISPFPFARSGRDLVWWVGNVLTGTRHLITVTGRVNGAGSGSFTNQITAATTTSETAMANNAGAWTVAILPDLRLYAVAPVNYAGLSREAAALINTGPH